MKNARTFFFMAVLVVCVSWVVIRAAQTAPANSSFSHIGEILLHDIGSMAEQVSYRLPGATVLSALLYHHPVMPWRDLVLLSQYFELVLIIALCSFLHKLGILIAAFAVIILYSFRWNFEFTPDTAFYRLVLLSACVMAWRARAPSYRRTAILALCLGSTLLYRSTFFALPPLIALYEWIAHHRRAFRSYWKHLLILCVVPYLFLIPWIGMNWVIHGRFIPFEDGTANHNIVCGALGIVENIEGDPRPLVDEPLDIRRSNSAVLGWAARVIYRHPMRYLSACLERVWFVIALHPWLVLLAAASLWVYRSRRDFQQLGLLAGYFVAIHCLMSVEERYFIPLWPVLSVLAAALIVGLRSRAPAQEGSPEYRFSQAMMKGVLGALLAMCLYTSWVVLSYAAGVQFGRQADIDAALRKYPRDSWLLAERGRRRLERGEIAGAVEDLSGAAALEPHDADLRLRRAWALAVFGQPAELLGSRVIPDPARTSKGSVYVNILKAAVYSRDGRGQEADRHLKEALLDYSKGYAILHQVERRRLEALRPSVQDVVKSPYTPTQLEKLMLEKMRAPMDDAFIDYSYALVGEGLLKEKLALSETLSRIFPKVVSIWLQKAATQAEMGSRAAAIKSLSRAEELNPSDQERRRMAGLYRRLKENARALAVLEPSFKRSTGASASLIEHAEVAAGLGDRIAALRSLARAEQSNPNDEQRRRLAALYRQLNEPARALAVLEPVLKRAAIPSPWIEGAELAAAAGKRAEALESLSRAEGLRPSDSQRIRLAEIYRQLDEPGRALAVLEPVHRSARVPAPWIERGELAAAAGNRALALESLERAETMSPSDEERRRIAAQYRSLGDYEKALAVLEALSRRLPKDARLWIDQADAAIFLQQNGRARKFLGRAETLDPGPDDWRRIAHGYQRLASYDQALAILERLRRRRPNQGDLYGDMGLCKYLKGSPESAIADLRTAIKLDPKLTSAYLSLGAIYAAQRRTDEARKILDRALLNDSSDPLRGAVLRARAELPSEKQGN